ncbi:uncharacterized protein LOC116292243, partial [Actinia tenebrosa]|uniref:Uncharacterized protein LOC116292243 n=1 Tax=Actinia tenebrosa TaxID=6105 RepID=A0A6P8HRW0_ACTTE
GTSGKVVSAGTCTPPPKDETEDFEVPPEEEWAVKDDPRLKVCDNFVQDLALDKPATQSSTFNQKELTAEELKQVDEKERNLIFSHSGPGLAVNGDMSFTLREGSCSHTSHSKDPWWKVDLGAEHIITDVSIQTTSEGTKVDALKNFEIRVGILQEFQKNPMCGERVAATHLGELWTSTCDPAIPGRYVSVQAFGETYLTLCEVAVFARKDNQGKCSTELKRRRSNIATVPHKDRVLKRAKITYGRYD